MLADHLDEIIELGAGIFFTWKGYVRPERNPRTRKVFRIAGPLLIVCAILLIVNARMGAAA